MFIIVSITDDNIPVILNLYDYIFTRSEILFDMTDILVAVFIVFVVFHLVVSMM